MIPKEQWTILYCTALITTTTPSIISAQLSMPISLQMTPLPFVSVATRTQSKWKAIKLPPKALRSKSNPWELTWQDQSCRHSIFVAGFLQSSSEVFFYSHYFSFAAIGGNVKLSRLSQQILQGMKESQNSYNFQAHNKFTWLYKTITSIKEKLTF